ncbi:MAG TPA: nucleoside-diphosphate kinase, partial [Ktedonobacterales bacterium]|nr:nucleoside-diphosphate kinase [Ktedonobacterales bacterium]
MERTLIIVKPEGVQRGLIGQVIARFEQKGLKVVGLKLLQIPREMAERHYAEHAGKAFYEGLVDHITSSPVVVGALEGPEAVSVTRAMMGVTNPKAAAPGTIRGDYGLDIGLNIVHGSDGVESAQREISIFFTPAELVDYER